MTSLLVLWLPIGCAKVTVLDGGTVADEAGSGGAAAAGANSVAGASGSVGSTLGGGSGEATRGGSGPSGGTTALASGGVATSGGSAGRGGTSATTTSASGGVATSASGGVATSASGGTTAVVIPYKNDFESASALSGWLRVDNAKAVTTQWTVAADSTNAANHVLQVGTLSDDTFEVGGNSMWSDQALEVKVKPTSTSGYLYGAVRYSGVNNYYFLQIQAGSKPKIRARTTVAGSSSTTDVCAGTVAAGTVGAWSTVVVTAKGSTIGASVDGSVVCTGTNADIPTGGIALGSDGVQAFFDDVHVTLPP